MQPLFAMIFLALRWHDVLDLINLLYLHMPSVFRTLNLLST